MRTKRYRWNTASVIVITASLGACRYEDPSAGVVRINAEQIAAPMDEVPTLGLPARPANAPTGTEFLLRTESLSIPQREAAIYEEIMQGNVPEHLRHLKMVELRDAAVDGTSALIWVLPDYLAIGSDEDFIRVPMNLITATQLARELGFVLPTKKIVDAVNAQATIRATPQPLPPSPHMRTNAYYLAHERLVADSLGHYALGDLVSGHKKDVVISNKLLRKPGSIVIYGWHQRDGVPIQPLSDVHDADYADYSHGIRLVADRVMIGGKPSSLTRAVSIDATAGIFNYEGRIERYGQLMNPTRIAQSGHWNSL